MPRLSDSALHNFVTGFDPCAAMHRMAAELIERRAADAPFAAGDKVTCPRYKGTFLVIGSDPRPEQSDCRFIIGDSNCGVLRIPIADLTPVPAAPTAVEVFAEAYVAKWREAYPSQGTTVGTPTDAAFREFCAAAGIDPDAPLVTDSEVAL